MQVKHADGQRPHAMGVSMSCGAERVGKMSLKLNSSLNPINFPTKVIETNIK